MMELFNNMARLPFVAMNVFAETMFVGAREFRRILDPHKERRDGTSQIWSVQPASGNRSNSSDSHFGYGNVPSWSYETTVPNGNDIENLPSLYSVTTSQADVPMLDNESHVDGEFFSNRDYVKTFMVTVTFVGEGDTEVLLHETRKTTQNTDLRCLESQIENEFAEMIREAVSSNHQMALPAPWAIPLDGEIDDSILPSFIKYVEDGNGEWYMEITEEGDRELERNINAKVQPISRCRIRSANDQRRQASALEGIEKVIVEIKENGLRSRAY